MERGRPRAAPFVSACVARQRRRFRNVIVLSPISYPLTPCIYSGRPSLQRSCRISAFPPPRFARSPCGQLAHPHFWQPQPAADRSIQRRRPQDQRFRAGLGGPLRRRPRREDRPVPRATRPGPGAGRAIAGGLRRRARGLAPHAGTATLRRAADRRHGAERREDRRNAHRRGQDAGRDAAGLSERAARQGRAHRHGQRVPRAARRRLDGAGL